MPAASTVGAVSYIEKIAGSDRHLNERLVRGRGPHDTPTSQTPLASNVVSAPVNRW